MKSVSIRTPMKGAIISPRPVSSIASVSIRTPMKGAIFRSQGCSLCLVCFNPHAHEGRDEISLVVFSSLLSCFNPHAHEGRDNISIKHYYKETKFQSARP